MNIGDVIKLTWKSFSGEYGTKLVQGCHLFVVIDITPSGELRVCPTSSKEYKVCDKYPYNIPLQNAKAAGFAKEGTHVKSDAYGLVGDEDVYQKVGSLSSEDLLAVQDGFIAAMKDRKTRFIEKMLSL